MRHCFVDELRYRWYGRVTPRVICNIISTVDIGINFFSSRVSNSHSPARYAVIIIFEKLRCPAAAGGLNV